ncbi:MAG TPA: hypothetical protein VEH06_12455 [Candidatus Bathyarchaeia archaeon]|nr:hypothetical protein [Candidatus Bathyarchaeia archaeon]
MVVYNEEVENRLNLRIEEELGRRSIYNPTIEIRYIEQTYGTMDTALVVDT